MANLHLAVTATDSTSCVICDDDIKIHVRKTNWVVKSNRTFLNPDILPPAEASAPSRSGFRLHMVTAGNSSCPAVS